MAGITGEPVPPLMPQVTFLISPIRPSRINAIALQEPLIGLGPLHRSDLEDAAGLLDDLFDQLAFVDRQRQRLFAVDVLAGQHRFDGDLRVPVIRRGDHHRVDVFAVEDLAIVLVAVGLLAGFLFRASYVLAPSTLASTSAKAAKSANLVDLSVIAQP